MNQKLLKKWWLMCIGLGVLLCQTTIAQDRQVSGKVSADDGGAIPGASVRIKGTTKGTTTDAAGQFKISVSDGTVLQVSSVGFTTAEVKVGTATTLNIILGTDAQALDEVIVTSLGIKEEKRALNYAAQEVKGKEIADSQRDNFLNSLQGRAAGLTVTSTSGQPGASAQIILRGASSIGGNNQPLFVVDGLPIDNSTFNQGGLVSDRPNRDNDFTNRAADINPNDIESVTILKGPEGAALYGIGAASGAIIITTKKGAKGKGKVSYDNRFQFDNVYRFPEVQNSYGRGTIGQVDVNAINTFGPALAAGTPTFDNIANFFQTGFTQNHNLGIEGGNENATYRFSTSYTDQKGIVPTTAFQNLAANLTGTTKIGTKLSVTTSFRFNTSTNIKAQRGNNGIMIGLLVWPAYDDARNYLNADGTRRILLDGISRGEVDNPYFLLNKNQNSDKTTHTVGNIQLEYKPLNWLSFTGNFGADIFTTTSNLLLHPESYQGTDPIGNGGWTAGGTIENAVQDNKLLNGILRTNITKNFGNFKTSLMLGTSFDDKDLKVTSNYGAKLYLPDFNSINNTDVTTQRGKYTQIRRRLVSTFGQFNLNYNDFWYFTVTGRNDWSSTLPVQNNSFFYPSFSTGFVMSELDAFKGLTFLSYWKLRASYAQVGKDAPEYKVLSSLTPQTTTGGGFAYGFFGGNPDLKPERTTSYEIGTDIRLFKGKIGIDAAFYHKDVADQIVSQRLSYGTGYIFGLLNGGTFTNEGVEISITAKPFKRKDFSWDMMVNFTKLNTTVKNLPANVPEYYNSDTWLYNNARASAFVGNLQDYYIGSQPLRAGESLNAAYGGINWNYLQRGLGSAYAIGGYSYARNKDGAILINPTNGLPISNALFLPIGDRNPDFTIGFQNNFTYKAFSLSFLLDIRKGGDVFNGTAMYMWNRGLSKNTLSRDQPMVFTGVLRDGRENSENPTKNTIQVTPGTRVDFWGGLTEESFVERNINWLRMRDITLRYDFPQSFLKKQNVFSRLGIYVTGNDLFLITNYTGADPAVNGNSATTLGVGAAGFDYATISNPRSFKMGINVTFK